MDAGTLVQRLDYTMAILLKGLKHLWVLVSAGGSWNQSFMIPRDNCIYAFVSKCHFLLS